jgi:lauroyl/myristoyl acyltransferase
MKGPAALPAWSLALQGPEYRWLLPALAALPDAIAYRAARARGRFNARHDRDWVSLGLRQRYIAGEVVRGCAMFVPPKQVAAVVRERFETVSREEVEVRALGVRGLAHFDIDARDALAALARRPRDRGIVLVTSHHETFVLGIAALAMRGEVIHPVKSLVTADPRLHPAVRDHFELKYAGLQRHLNGGELAPAETSIRHFYRALARHEAMVMLVDAPAPPGGPSVVVPWLGARRHLAQGAFRIAERSGSLLAAFGCRWHGGRRHTVSLSKIVDARELGAQRAAAHAFAFLEHGILELPGRWWASHLLPACRAAAVGAVLGETGQVLASTGVEEDASGAPDAA